MRPARRLLEQPAYREGFIVKAVKHGLPIADIAIAARIFAMLLGGERHFQDMGTSV